MTSNFSSNDKDACINHEDIQSPAHAAARARGAAAAVNRDSSSGGDEPFYVPNSRRQSRASKEKIRSANDYIRTVMQQLQSDQFADGATNPLPGTPTTGRQQVHTSARGGRNASSTSSEGDSDQQQVWLMIVERMREEISTARDVHRADYYQSKSTKRRRFSSSVGEDGSFQEERNSHEAGKQPYCTVCQRTKQISPATATTICGHYLCWDCLCKWHRKDVSSSSTLTASKKECPCCKKTLSKSQVIFLGEKAHDVKACQSSYTPSTLATAGHRDKLLRAAAIPILSSRLHNSVSEYKYKPSIDASLGATNPKQRWNEMGGELCLHDNQHNQTLISDQAFKRVAEKNSLISEGEGLGLGLDSNPFIYKSGCTDLPARLMMENYITGSSEVMLAHTKQAAALLTHNNIAVPGSETTNSQENSSNGQAITEKADLSTHQNDAALQQYGIHVNPQGSSHSRENNIMTTLTSSYDEEEGSTAVMMGEYIQKALEIETNEEDLISVAERNELMQLQEALRQQLASETPMNVQCSAWFSTFLGTTSPTQKHVSSNINIEAPSCGLTPEPQELVAPQISIGSTGFHNAEMISRNPLIALEGYCGHSSRQFGAEQQALNFSSESTFSSTSVLSPSAPANNLNIIDTCIAPVGGSESATAICTPHQDDATSNWTSFYDEGVDDAWAWPSYMDDGLYDEAAVDAWDCWEY